MKALQTDIDTELALLGSVLREPSRIHSVSDVFKPALFTGPNATVAHAIAALLERRRPIDPVTVNAVLRDKGALGVDVASDHVDLLVANSGTSANVRDYCDRLDRLRALREYTHVITELLRDPEPDGYAAIEKAQKRLGTIAHGGGNDCEHVFAASQTVLDGFAELRDNPDAVEQPFETGFKLVDESINFQVGHLVVFAARPSVGKSSFAVSFAHEIAKRGVGVGVFWLEDDRADFVKRLHARNAFLPVAAFKRPRSIPPEQWDRLIASHSDIGKLPLWITDTHGLTANEVAARMRFMKHEHGVRVFLADHLGEIRIEQSQRWGDRNDLAIGQVVYTYRDAAKELGALPVLMAQMNRRIEGRGEDAPPRMSDIDGSGKVEQAARTIAFLSRPASAKDQLVIDITKNMDGPTHRFALGFNGPLMTVENR